MERPWRGHGEAMENQKGRGQKRAGEAMERPEESLERIERWHGGTLATAFFEVASEIFAVKHLPPRDAPEVGLEVIAKT